MTQTSIGAGQTFDARPRLLSDRELDWMTWVAELPDDLSACVRRLTRAGARFTVVEHIPRENSQETSYTCTASFGGVNMVHKPGLSVADAVRLASAAAERWTAQ